MSLVKQREVEITNTYGLHLRAAERFVRLALTYSSRIEVSLAGTVADGKSILDLACLAAMQGARLRLDANGPDAEQALSALTELVRSEFAESPAQSRAESVPLLA